MKEAVFHPEARAEVEQSAEFYETRLDGLGLRFLSATIVKTTWYFEHVRKRPDRVTIRDEWIAHVIEHPERSETQSDGRIKRWARITEAGKILRVILREVGETVHNAFFDRSFREGEQ